MKTYHSLHEIRYSDITPEGWLREILLSEKAGMPGNLDRIGHPFSTPYWEYRTLPGERRPEWWWPFEQTAYWIDAMVRLSGLLRYEALYEKVRRSVEVAVSPESPWIGPEPFREEGRCYKWPLGVFARALYARRSFTGDDRYLERLRDHYLGDSSDYGGYRDVVNVETMLRVYERLGDERLLKKAVATYEKFDRSDEEYSSARAMESDIIPMQHGVTYNEQAKLAAILYSYTGKERYLEAAKNGYDKIDRYAMLPDGVCASCEFTYGNQIKWPHESCDISDYTWSMGYILEATGESKYADRIERAVLNAAFGAIGPGFRTIQYFSAVNQTIAARNSTCVDEFMDSPRMAYRAYHYPECCVANLPRVFPNYVLRMYQRTEEGVAVSLYGDSVYDGEDMRICQTGGYPVGDTVRFEISFKEETGLQTRKLRFRIPYWAGEYRVNVNGRDAGPDDLTVRNGYAEIPVRNGDVLELSFKKEFAVRESAEGGIYFEYGPFLMALRIDERWEVDDREPRQTKEFPAYNVYPASAWNYCVSGREKPEIIPRKTHAGPCKTEEVAWWEHPPFEIRIDARVLEDWKLTQKKMTKPVRKPAPGLTALEDRDAETIIREDRLLTPELPDAEFVKAHLGRHETITLVPYACTHLRVAVFPRYRKEWDPGVERSCL